MGIAFFFKRTPSKKDFCENGSQERRLERYLLLKGQKVGGGFFTILRKVLPGKGTAKKKVVENRMLDTKVLMRKLKPFSPRRYGDKRTIYGPGVHLGSRDLMR